MAVVLEVKAGPAAGKRVSVVTGQTVTIGRAAGRANFALPHDTYMSGLHFTVECNSNGCKLIDRKSSNGTFVNGARVTEIFLNNGDEVRSGQTVFAVRMIADEPTTVALAPARPAITTRPPQPAVAPPSPPSIAQPPRPPKAPAGRDPSMAPSEPPVAPSPGQRPSQAPRQKAAEPIAPHPGKKISPKNAAIVIGAWSFTAIPQGWEAQGEYGMQRSVQGSFPSSAVVSEESLSLGLRDYVEAQVGTLRQYLRDPQIEAVMPPQIPGVEETIAVEVRYKTKDGQLVFYHQIYARAGRLAGVLTFTTLEGELAKVRPEFEAILGGASFTPQSPAQV